MTCYQTRPLGDLCDVLDSKRKPVTKKDRVSGQYPYYGATGILDYVDDYIFDEPLILVGEDGAKWGAGENTAFCVIGRCWVNNHAHVLRPRRNIAADKWIIYYLNANDLSPFITGLTVPKLNQAKLREIPIPVPPIPEQKRIIAILDEAFDGIDAAAANAEKNLTSARELFDKYLQSVFHKRGKGWTEMSLGEVAQIKGGKRVPKGYKLLTETTPFPYLRVTDFTETGTVDTSNLRYIDEKIKKHIKNYIISSNDIYVSIAGTIGRTGIVPETLDGAQLTENACRLVFRPGFSNKFVYYFTLTSDFINQTTENTRTSAQPKLALSRLSTIRLSFPDLATQERLADSFALFRVETQRLETIYRLKLAHLTELKQAILQKAFIGALTASDVEAVQEAAE